MKFLPFILLFVFHPLFSCKYYSFTGASIPPEIKTIQVDYFQNNASGGPAVLSQIFTENLKEKFLSDTNLKLVTTNGDIVFKGFISSWQIIAKAPVEGQTTAINELNISVKLDYINSVFPKENWSRSFSAFAQFDSSIDLLSVQDELIEDITGQLADDIFIASMVKW